MNYWDIAENIIMGGSIVTLLLTLIVASVWYYRETKRIKAGKYKRLAAAERPEVTSREVTTREVSDVHVFKRPHDHLDWALTIENVAELALKYLDGDLAYDRLYWAADQRWPQHKLKKLLKRNDGKILTLSDGKHYQIKPPENLPAPAGRQPRRLIEVKNPNSEPKSNQSQN